jgi:hypothetical protein
VGDAPLFRGPETALRELAALELVYLFVSIHVARSA